MESQRLRFYIFKGLIHKYVRKWKVFVVLFCLKSYNSIALYKNLDDEYASNMNTGEIENAYPVLEWSKK